MNADQPIQPDSSAELDLEAPPDLVLLERVEGEMMRVDATLAQLGNAEGDPDAVTSWIPSVD